MAADANSNITTFLWPAPTNLTVITGLTPEMTNTGSSAITLVVNGNNFAAGATVLWNGISLTPQGSASQLNASIPSADLSSAGIVNITVANPASTGGGTSGTYNFVIDTAPGTPGAFTVGSANTSLIVQHGLSAQLQVTFTGLASGASLSATCVNLPSGASCGYANGVVTISTSGATVTGVYPSLVVFTATQQIAALAASGNFFFATLLGFAGLPLGLIWLGAGRKKAFRYSLVLSVRVIAVPAIGRLWWREFFPAISDDHHNAIVIGVHRDGQLII